jgi:hypothetical protein
VFAIRLNCDAASAAPAAPAAAAETPAAEAALDPELAGFETERLIAHLQRLAYRITLALARQRRLATRQAHTPSGPRQSKATELNEAAARGVMPTKPDVTSHANSHYQKRFDKLAQLAAAGDWDGVAPRDWRDQCGFPFSGVRDKALLLGFAGA